MDLLECRNKLDVIDKQIVKLFEERMDICGKVAEPKIATGKAVYDAEREKQKLEAVSAMAGSDFNQIAVRELFSQMMSISRKYQYGVLPHTDDITDFEKTEKEGMSIFLF